MEITLWAFGIVETILLGVAVYWLNYKQKKRYEEVDKRERLRLDGELVQLSLLLAECKLSKATAIALKRGYANGEVEDGLEEYDKAMKNFQDYERELVVRRSLYK